MPKTIFLRISPIPLIQKILYMPKITDFADFSDILRHHISSFRKYTDLVLLFMNSIPFLLLIYKFWGHVLK